MTVSGSDLRVLAVDADPGVLEDYRLVLEPKPADGDTALDRLEADLFGVSSSRRRLPEVRLTTCARGELAIIAALEATHSGQPFAMAFIDLRMPPGIDGFEIAARLRALDPYLYIVIVTASTDHHPLDIAEQIPPADRLFFLRKPFHGPEIQQLVNALGTRWRAEAALRESAPLLQRLAGAQSATAADVLQHLPAGVALFDRDDRLLCANPALRQMYPSSAGFEAGATYEDILHAMSRIMHDGTAPGGTDAWIDSRLQWHKSGSGILEQRVGEARRILLLEQRLPDGRCIVLHIEATECRSERPSSVARLAIRSLP